MDERDDMDEMDNSSPSLGETRAADVPSSLNRPRGQSTPFFERTVDMPRYSSPPPRTTRVVSSDTQGGTSRYCGTCGARIERGEVFCGQCGTPVGASGNNLVGRSAVSGAPSRYMVGDADPWSPGQGNDLTEAFVPSPPTPMPAAYNRGAGSAPYNQGYGFAGSMPGNAAQAENGSARTTRVVWGVVCLVASLITAVGAVVLVVAR